MLIRKIEVGGGGGTGNQQGMAQVQPQLGAGGGDPLTVQVVGIGGHQLHIQTQQPHIVGNVPAHTA